MQFFVTKKKLKKIQAMAAEGAENPVDLESLLTGVPLSENGSQRLYRSYGAQTSAIYRKYNGRDEVGNPQTRGLLDLRKATIAGEGISIQAENENTGAWINDFLNNNKLKGSRFPLWVLGGEMAGKSLVGLVPDKVSKFVRTFHYPFTNGADGIDYRVKLNNIYDFDTIKDVEKKAGTGYASMKLKTGHFQYVRLGGDDCRVNETTTKVGLCLHEIESYDRALNGMRKNNHLFSRITPTFQTTSLSETTALQSWIARVKWKIGIIFAGTAKLEYVGPPETAHGNYKTEMEAAAKVISMVTGMPIHWIGHVDMMSNRSTAAELYDLINNATVIERVIWAEALKEIIIKAMKISIESSFENKTVKRGKAILSIPDDKFTVNIPVMSWSRMESYIKALSLAFNDGVISDLDYQGKLPDIDPYVTNKRLEQQKAEEAKLMAQAIDDGINDDKPDDSDDKDENEKD